MRAWISLQITQKFGQSTVACGQSARPKADRIEYVLVFSYHPALQLDYRLKKLFGIGLIAQHSQSEKTGCKLWPRQTHRAERTKPLAVHQTGLQVNIGSMNPHTKVQRFASG